MIPDQVLTFVHSSIKSVWALELLLLVRRSAAHAWDADQLTAELRSSPLVVSEILAAFKRSRLIVEESEGIYRYKPQSAEVEDLVHQLEQIYAERPLALIKEIVTAPNEKIQTFADAFRLKKD